MGGPQPLQGWGQPAQQIAENRIIQTARTYLIGAAIADSLTIAQLVCQSRVRIQISRFCICLHRLFLTEHYATVHPAHMSVRNPLRVLMPFRILVAFFLLLAVAVSPTESSWAQSSTQTDLQDFQNQVDDWNADLDIAEQLITDSDPSPDAAEFVKRTVTRVISQATSARKTAEEKQAELQTNLNALGPAPDENEAPPEPDPVARERARLNEALAQAKSHIALADLTVSRATALEAKVGVAQRSRLYEDLVKQGPLPYEPSTLTKIPGNIGQFIAQIGIMASDWWGTFLQQQKQYGTVILPGIFILIGVVIAWWLRSKVLKRFGPFPVEEAPPYSRRLLAATADGVARGIIPAVILIVIIVRTRTDGGALNNDFGLILRLVAESLLIFVLATALPHAALSPDDPDWRLTLLSPNQAKRILALLTPLALLFCIDEFVTRAGVEVGPLQGILTPEFFSTWTLIFNLAQGGLALALLQRSLWTIPQTEAEPVENSVPADTLQDDVQDDPEDQEDQPRRTTKPFWALMRAILILITCIGALAPAFGYINLGNFLLNNILGTAILVSILYILRGLFREGIALTTRSTVVRHNLALRHKTRSRLKFSARFILDIVIVLVGISVIAPNWGVSETDLLRGARTILGGLQVGSVKISVTDILLSIFVFIACLALVRALNRSLAEKILPETEIEESLRHTITAGIGYIGFIFATGMAVAVAGVDLTNIALIAGALSVGIGFGLQNIVNNFVSGLILLIERPIKIGDWVVVGPNEGFVKQINMRATEIETWQKASVIIPNADLLSQALKNWTHKDKIGRVDVPIGVALDSDIDHVCEVLLEIGRAHPRCRKIPEPVALVMNIGESRIDMELRIFTSDILWVLWISSDLHKEILRRFPKEGIVIPYAQRVVHLNNVIPSESSPSKPTTEDPNEAKPT
jgi:small-conductance mechanosensitive channel